VLHRTRHLFIRQQTAVINSIRAHLAEFGIVAPVGRKGVTELLHVVCRPERQTGAKGCPCVSCRARRSTDQPQATDCGVRSDDHGLAPVQPDEQADPRTFQSGRNFSAWIGLVPKQHSSGGKDRLGSISKQGDRYLRSLFVAGALAVIRYAKSHGTKHRPWLTALLRAAPDEGRRHRTCQQDCADGLGHDGQG
jgi:transposase